MTTEIIKPKDEQDWLTHRMHDVTSTEISALFGISPYATAYELWHRKKDTTIVKLEENKRMFWGTTLQTAIAEGFAKENGWTIRRKDEYIRNAEHRIGASFDFELSTGELLEIKNVDGLVFKKEWLYDENSNLFAPLHIEIQVQMQLLVSEKDVCYLGVLVGGNDHHLLKRTRDEKVMKQIKKKVAEFWKSIEENKPPEPNFEVDAEFISELFAYAEPGKVIDVSGDETFLELAVKYKEYGDAAKEAEEKKKQIRAEMLQKIGDAEKVLGNGFTVSAGTVAPCHVEYDRAGYRNLRLTFKKQKEEF